MAETMAANPMTESATNRYTSQRVTLAQVILQQQQHELRQLLLLSSDEPHEYARSNSIHDSVNRL